MEIQKNTTFSKWPCLNKLLANKCLSYLDLALAERLLRNHTNSDESIAALICHLSSACRQGHLCVLINDHELFPDPIYCLDDINENLSTEKESILSELRSLIKKRFLHNSSLSKHCRF